MMCNKLLIVILFFAFTQVKAQKEIKFKTYWDKGYHFDSEDGNFKLKFGGRIQQEWAFFNQDSENDSLFGTIRNSSEFRRVRFYNSGTIYQSIDYKLQFDFAGGSANLKDAYITLKEIPLVGNLRVGHFKEPFGLDQMNSSNDMTFIERAPSYDMAPGRNNGFLLFNTLFNKKITWAIGTYRETNGLGKTGDDEQYNYTGRLTAVPIYNEEKNRLLHLGVAYSYRNPDNDEYSLKSKPEAHLAPIFIGTGTIADVTKTQLLGAEFAFVEKSFSLQAEYIYSALSTSGILGDLNFSSYYAEASFFLTGEHRVYSKKVGFFKRVSPKNNYNPKDKKYGGLEVAIRYSHTDYSSGLVLGGELDGFTAGLNWYLNPITRISLNHSVAKLVDAGTTNITQLKFQVTF